MVIIVKAQTARHHLKLELQCIFLLFCMLPLISILVRNSCLITCSIDTATTMAATPTPNAGQSTPEYLTLRKSYTSLVAHITPQTGDISGALFEKGYIPPAVLDYVTTLAIPNNEKALKLVGALLAKVELDPSVYHGFMSILKSEGQSADTIVEQLEEAYKAEQATLAECDGSK